MDKLELISTTQAAPLMHVSVRRVCFLCKTGRIGMKVGRNYVLSKRAAQAWRPLPVGRPKGRKTH